MANVQLAVAGDETTQVILSVPGVQGPAGSNLPPSGTTHQLLYKQSSTDYDTGWKLITNDNVDASAAIAGTKISPDFGSQNAVTTGTNTAASFIPTSSSVPANGLYLPSANNVAISTNGTGRLSIDTNGHVTALTGGMVVAGSPSGFGGGEVALGAATASLQSAISTASTGTPALIFDHRGASNTGSFIWRNGTGGSSELMRVTGDGKLGLGTSSVGARFHLKENTADTYGIIRLEGNNRGGEIDFYNGATAQAAIWGNSSTLNFGVGPSFTQAMIIDSSGRLGVGTTSPSSTLDVNGDCAVANTKAYQVKDSGGTTRYAMYMSGSLSPSAGNDLFIGNTLANSLVLYTNSAERARIDSSGRLLVGTTSESGNSLLTVRGNTGSATGAGVLDIGLGTTRPGSADTPIGYIRFTSTSNTSSNYHYASIAAESDGTSSSDTDIPGRLVFSTTADGASSPTERMRITSGGKILLGGKTASTGAEQISLDVNSAVNFGIGIKGTNSGNDAVFMRFYNLSDVQAGQISQTGSTTVSYTTSSDYRLKENVVPLAGAIDRLRQIPVHRFNFIADPAKTVDGFIAHEVQSVVPEAITGKKDAVDDDGNPVYQGIDQSKLVPLLTAALQEAIGEIESLKARVAALESA